MSPVKEPQFFAFDTANPTHRSSNSFPIKSMEAYRYLFSGASNEKTIGEVSPAYFYSRRAATAILAHIPDAKLIVSLRNPIDRTASVYSMLSGSARENARSGRRRYKTIRSWFAAACTMSTLDIT
ncbi:MAG TPA: sulfotransferase [Gammaproteobacteria bacterium]|nr:sulfotransferase [Gammaproteobacteria bacterium]